MAKKKKRRYKKKTFTSKERYVKKKTTGEKIFIASLYILTAAVWIGCYCFGLEKHANLICAGTLGFIGLVAILYYSNKKSGKRYLRYGFARLNNLTGEEFEELLKAYFRKNGYKVQLTPKSGDYGADLIVKKNGEKIIVQAKRYKGSVGISAVQEVIGAKEYYNGDKALVITNSYFTPAAKELAGKTKVKLWDGKVVAEIIEKKRLPGI